MQIGRIEIYTDVVEITSENIIQILQKALLEHNRNRERIKFLLEYEAGLQPLQRDKAVRADIDIQTHFNLANFITEFKLAYVWGYPITLIQRGEKDSGAESEAEGIAILNESYEAECHRTKTQKLARFVEICGIGYTFVDLKKTWADGDALFQYETLDPMWTFVVRSSYYLDKRIMLSVTYRRDEKGFYHYTCFTNNRRYEVLNAATMTNGEVTDDWHIKQRSGELNPIGINPITEYIRSHDRMGCFERQIELMDGINLLESDMLNDVDQNTQAIWHTNDVDFPKNTDGNDEHPKSNDWVQTYTSPDGKTPFIKPLTVNYDYSGMLSNLTSMRSTVLQECNVPLLNDNSGGSTGIAMDAATGWSAAEASARKQTEIIEGSKMNEVKVVLAAVKSIGNKANIPVDSPVRKLRYCDVQPNIRRNKSFELVSKTNSFATLVSHGINGLHALKVCDMFEDVNQTWTDSKEGIAKYQESVYGNKNEADNHIMQDESDQQGQSPILGGENYQKQYAKQMVTETNRNVTIKRGVNNGDAGN